MTLAKRIRECRYAKGWGPDELASRADISRTALYQIECGKTETPRAGTLRRIAEALEVSIDALMGHAAWEFEAGEPVARTMDRRETPADYRLDDPAGRSAMTMPFLGTLRPVAPSRESEVERKFQELLASPLGESVARIIEESHRLLPKFRMG